MTRLRKMMSKSRIPTASDSTRRDACQRQCEQPQLSHLTLLPNILSSELKNSQLSCPSLNLAR
jgi:hypothetical protein